MIYTIHSRRDTLVAGLRTWDGKVIDTSSASGHWTWCVGRNISTVLAWARNHHMRWAVAIDSDTVWGEISVETQPQ